MSAPTSASRPAIASVRLIVGMEVHVELSTRTKAFTAAPSIAVADAQHDDAEPNSLLDPVVLALPGALPVLNRVAIEQSMLVGMALGCEIPSLTKWDRKCYTYPDLPKGYQLSQYDQPICGPGVMHIPPAGDDGEPDWTGEPRAIRITRAHLEEDAGKLLHDAPGGGTLDHSIVDLNRAGTPLLEIVTEPDFAAADDAVIFCRLLRQTCRFLGVTRGVMQKGHMRFEPNINCELTLADGSAVRTPVVEIKNLNSFRAVRAAIEYEREQQPKRWLEDGRVMGRGAKSTRGWDDARGVTTPQREKEDADDYRYFPDPDLRPVEIGDAWRDAVRARLPELPADRARRYTRDDGLTAQEVETLIDERTNADLYDDAVDSLSSGGLARTDAARAVANLVFQVGARLANERGTTIGELGITAGQLAAIAGLRAGEAINAANAGKLFEVCADAAEPGDPEAIAEREGWLAIRDTGQLEAWCDEVIAANGPIVEQIRDGKQQAVGRLIGEVMKKSGGAADAKTVRDMLLGRIGG